MVSLYYLITVVHTLKLLFEDITKKEFEKLVKLLQDVNLENVIEETDETDLSGELACAGGSCEITSL